MGCKGGNFETFRLNVFDQFTPLRAHGPEQQALFVICYLVYGPQNIAKLPEQLRKD